MRLVGRLLKAHRSNGSFTAEGGRDVAYDNWVYKVLEGSEVVEVKIKASEPQPSARPGDDIVWDVAVPEKTKCVFLSEVPDSALV